MDIKSLVNVAAKIGKGRCVPLDQESSVSFSPIEGLKAGDRLRYMGGAGYICPEKDAEVCVYSTDLPDFISQEENRCIYRSDFSIVAVDSSGDIHEYAMDSRYFERV